MLSPASESDKNCDDNDYGHSTDIEHRSLGFTPIHYPLAQVFRETLGEVSHRKSLHKSPKNGGTAMSNRTVLLLVNPGPEPSGTG